MNQNNKTIFKIYARKSSEAEDRQVLSIGSQIDADKKIALQRNIEISDSFVLSESRSAKNPYDRPVFEQLIKEIESGKIQGIIAWHPNRLSRNAIDAARLIDLIDKGKLMEIITSQQSFRNTPSDKFFLSMLCSQAKMENDNKSIDVKRGLRKKYEMGFPPNLAKIGYLNDCGNKGERKWLKDPERFELVKQLLELYSSKRISVRDLLKYSDEVLGLRTVQRKKEGGKPLKLSALYSILKDPFFAGFFYANNEDGERVRYEVNKSIPRILSEEQYWKNQEKLGWRGLPRPSKYKRDFVYKKYTKCGTCGGSVTAEHKYQVICSNCKKKFSYLNKTKCPECETDIEKMEDPTYLHYIYYHCTKQRKLKCAEPAIQEVDVDKNLANYFENKIQISPDLRNWLIEHMDEPLESDKQSEAEVVVSWEKERDQKKKEYDELVIMRTKNIIDDATLERLGAPIQTAIKKAENEIINSGEDTIENRREQLKKDLNLAVGISTVFRVGTFEEKEGALLETGSNLTLKDKKLDILMRKELIQMANVLLSAKMENEWFEPKDFVLNTNKTDDFSPVLPETSNKLRR